MDKQEKQSISQGPVEEYTVLAYCQDKQFAEHGRQRAFTCKGVAKATGVKIEMVQEIAVSLVERNWLNFIDEDQKHFVLKGHHQSFGYNDNGQLKIRGWEEEIPREELIRRLLRP